MKSGFCVLWGRPNVGKSTLLNALMGRKHVIVSPRPQTTRHRITGVLHHDDYQIVFLDTPGIHAPQHKLGETLNKTARGSLGDIECVLFVTDSTDMPHEDDKLALRTLLKSLKRSTPIILVMNKIDAAENVSIVRESFERLIAEQNRKFEAALNISAATGAGLDSLKSAIVARLPEGDPYFPPEMLGDRPPEFQIEERVREQAMLQLREEIPHAIAVTVETMEPRKDGTLYVEAFVNVERDSQKRIVIGAGGSRIKEIGQIARAEIEALLDRKVYLELRVKVRDNWRDSDIWISRLGYREK
ncbi:MAG TPA: GTPase Era [Abditibacteriaceae bacterium]|jgi:GTP-binding protein Era